MLNYTLDLGGGDVHPGGLGAMQNKTMWIIECTNPDKPGWQLAEHIVRGVSTASNLKCIVLLAADLGENQSKTMYKACVFKYDGVR